MKTAGSILVLFSLIFWFMSVNMTTTVSTGDSKLDLMNELMTSNKVYNMGLMQEQTINTTAAGILFLAGIFLLGLSELEKLLKEKLTSIENKIPKIPPSA